MKRVEKSGFLVLPLLLLLAAGCTTTEVTRIPPNEMQQTLQQRAPLLGVTTIAGEEIAFDPPGGQLRDGVIQASVNQAPYSVPITNVQRLWIEESEFSVIRTLLLAAGYILAAAAFAG